jgi:hypothetical protein
MNQAAGIDAKEEPKEYGSSIIPEEKGVASLATWTRNAMSETIHVGTQVQAKEAYLGTYVFLSRASYATVAK